MAGLGLLTFANIVSISAFCLENLGRCVLGIS